MRYDDLLEELTKLRNSLEEALAKPKGATEDDVWSAYAGMERLAAILKLRMGVEGPGELMEVPKSKTPEEFVPAALGSAGIAVELLGRGELAPALDSIRKSRTSLRADLAEKNRARMREKRRASKASRPSSS